MQDVSRRVFDLVEAAVRTWPEFETDEEVNGADLVEWFAGWLYLARQLMGQVNQQPAAYATAKDPG
jgi:hypothetical protein